MMNDPVIQTDRLTRYFGSKCAVDTVSIAVPRGSVYALLGRNGSGKTTLIRMLLGLLEPTRGASRVLGLDSQRLTPPVRARVGYMAEAHPLYGWMRVQQLAAFQKSFYPRWDDAVFKAVVDHFQLASSAKAGDLSRGERAGLSLALTMAAQPEVLILDDPALGLDPVARRSLLESMIYLTRRNERTILFSSHLLGDVERVADHVAILDRSVLRAQCSLEIFRQRVQQVVGRFDKEAPPTPEIRGLLYSQRDGNELRMTVANAAEETVQALRALGAQEIEQAPVSFEDAVIGYLGHRGERRFFLENIKGAA